MALRHWSTTASGNASAAGVNWQEGQAPSTVNNSAREMMAQMRAQYAPGEWHWIAVSNTASVASQTSFKLSSDLTAHFHAARRVRLTGGSNTRYASIVSSSYTAETTVTVMVDAGSLSASHTIAALGPAVTSSPIGGVARIDQSNTFTAEANFKASVSVSATLTLATGLKYPDGNVQSRVSGWQLLEDSGPLSAVASYTKDGIPSTINHLMIIADLVPDTDSAAIYFYGRKGAGVDVATVAYNTPYALGTAWAPQVDSASGLVLCTAATSTVANKQGTSLTLFVYNIQSSVHKRTTGQSTWWVDGGATEMRNAMIGGLFQDTAPITGFRLQFSAGNIAAGRVRVSGC